MLRREYVPLRTIAPTYTSQTSIWAEPILQGKVTADELLRRYCTSIYAMTSSYEQTANQLGIDRRTVKAKLDLKLLQQLLEHDAFVGEFG